MELIKIKKSLLKKNWVAILTELGAVNEKLKQAFPGSVYMSAADIKTVRANTKAQLKKEHKSITKKHLDYSEAMHFLNLGASSRFENALKPGYVLVDTDEIQRETMELTK